MEFKYSVSHLKDYKWTFLNEFDYLISETTGLIKSYIKSNESVFNDKLKTLNELINNDPYLKMDDCQSEDDLNAQASYFESQYGLEQKAIEQLIIFHRNSTLVSVFSFFESKFKEICESIEDEIKPRVSLKDLRGDGDIDQLKKFINKVFGLDFVKSKKHLDAINNQKIIRNKIVHNNSIISKDAVRLVKPVAGLTLREYYLNDDKLIFISSDKYLINLLNHVESFFRELLVEIDEKWTS